MSTCLSIDPTKLKANPHRVRTFPNKQINTLVKFIRQTNAMKPIIVDETMTVLANEAEHLAALKMKKASVDVYVLENLSEKEKRAFALAAEKIPELGGWDRSATAKEVAEVRGLLAEEGIDIEITGFSEIEIDQMVIDFEAVSREPSDDISKEMISVRPVTRFGDVWLLGRHRLMCADAGEADAHARLMVGKKADMGFFDFPYNQQAQDIGGRGSIRHENFAMAAGELSPEQLETLAKKWMRTAAAVSRDGAVHFICADWRCVPEFARAGREVYGKMLNLVVWTKSNGGLGTFYRSQHELIGVFVVGKARHRNNVQLGAFGRSRTNVWTYPGSNGFRSGRMEDLKAHPTPKPVMMISDAMRDCTRRDDLVLDTFCGSGTTILAAERVGRIAYGMEIEPKFVDVAIRRWQAFTRKDAIHEASGRTFGELEAERLAATTPVARVRLLKSEPTPRVRLKVA